MLRNSGSSKVQVLGGILPINFRTVSSRKAVWPGTGVELLGLRGVQGVGVADVWRGLGLRFRISTMQTSRSRTEDVVRPLT